MEEFCLKKSIFYVDFFLVLFELAIEYRKLLPAACTLCLAPYASIIYHQ